MKAKPKTDIDGLFAETKQNGTYLKVCAPMVRYSKVQFRNLVKKYGVDLCFTPMILADSFCQSSKARLNEFSTNVNDTPLIVQYAAKTTYDFVGASEYVFPYADGVDLNCGCPQRWAMKDGYGCSLLNEPDTIHDLVRTFKNRLPNTFSVSVKIRLLNNFKDTIELCRRMENCGINFLTVHGRKSWHKSNDPVDIDSLKIIGDTIKIPFIANGNVKSLDDADKMFENVNCDGVMAAQGILTNPAMFTNEKITPISCVQDWIDISYNQKKPMTFQCFHHHLVFMLEKVLKKKNKQIFNNLSTYSDVYEFLEENFQIKPRILNSDALGEDVECIYEDLDYNALKRMYSIDGVDEHSLCIKNEYDPNTTDGKYFKSKVSKDDCDLDNMDSTLFDE